MDNNLKKIREEAGLSQAELSDKSGVARTIISFLETKKDCNVKVNTLIALANALNESVENIFLLR